MSNTTNNILTLVVSGALLPCVASNLVAEDIPGRWYLGLDTGLALQQDINFENTTRPGISFDPGFRLDLSGGVHLSRSWKAEVELGVIYNSVSSGGGDYLVQVPMMVNGVYTLPLDGGFSVYAGAGVGGVAGMLWNGFWSSEDSFAFGYQGILGAKYAINDNLDLGLAYKFLGTFEHELGEAQVAGTYSHCILGTFTFKF